MSRFERLTSRATANTGAPWLHTCAVCALAAQLAVAPFSMAVPSGASTDKPVTKDVPGSDAVLKAMQAELTRANTDLTKTDQPPYYLSYTVYDQDFTVLVGSYGSLLQDFAAHRRSADVAMRVGTPALDNTHGQSRPSGVTSGSLPLGNDEDALQRVLWELTDREYKRAVPALLNVRTGNAVRAEEEDKSPDFSKESPTTHIGKVSAAPAFDHAAWSGEIKRLSAEFRRYPEVYFDIVSLTVQDANARMVSSEGSAVVTPSVSTRLVMEGQTRANDGMELLRV